MKIKDLELNLPKSATILEFAENISTPNSREGISEITYLFFSKLGAQQAICFSTFDMPKMNFEKITKQLISEYTEKNAKLMFCTYVFCKRDYLAKAYLFKFEERLDYVVLGKVKGKFFLSSCPFDKPTVNYMLNTICDIKRCPHKK